MTAKERARLHGFWTHKQTGERIAVSRVTMYGEAHARTVDSLGHERHVPHVERKSQKDSIVNTMMNDIVARNVLQSI
ncbi:hypothetical protein [Bacillus sp. AFS075034]|uniref:hypothetical protein n=1 Tax=Bacillus sp. AFS075034 TaxID=2034281 RepID=UPI000BF61FBE|nr:hypothetical protein [Bacillus sp. AFS075034]PFW57862.1 hypothetical protein COL20_26045 [Bacillus sp. AFS075034]